MAAQATQDHRISIIEGGSSSRTRPVQPVSLSGMTRTLGGFGQCGQLCPICWSGPCSAGCQNWSLMFKFNLIYKLSKT